MWSKRDVKWLREKYPALKVITPHMLEGKVSFQMLRLNGQYFIDPSSSQIMQTSAPDYLYLCGNYDIRIEKNSSDKYISSREMGGKIALVAKKLGKEKKDMHLYPDETLCLSSPMDLELEFENEFKLQTYIEKFLIPYLFAQTYYAKKQIWIWGDLSHGIWGLLEWLGRKENYTLRDVKNTYLWLQVYSKQESADIEGLLKTRCRAHKSCPCGSNKKTRECHPDVRHGITRLRIAINNGLS